MSRKAKGIDTDKLLEQIALADIDDQIRFYHKLKNQLSAILIDKAKYHEEIQNKLLGTAKEIISDCRKPEENAPSSK
jgi:cytidylate kinase